MTLSETRTLSASIVRRTCSHLRVVGVLPRKGSAFVEVLLDGGSCPTDSCRMMLTLDRNAPETFTATLQDALRLRRCEPEPGPSPYGGSPLHARLA